MVIDAMPTARSVIDSPAMLSTDVIWKRLADVPDPEIPVISIVDLGIVRDVAISVDGICTVTLTPTYSGCPATEVIAADVREALSSLGCEQVVVQTQLSPAWTTDWMNEATKAKLREYGIAPPHVTLQEHQAIDISRIRPFGLGLSKSSREPSTGSGRTDLFAQTVSCPRCKSTATETLSQYGSTPCKAQYRCLACREPFDYFKPH
jgi:ring-1,2-phenylacetyl-CoA epoxidase subunit PaaD